MLLDSPRAVVLFGVAVVVLLAPLVVKIARRDRALIREQDGRVDEEGVKVRGLEGRSCDACHTPATQQRVERWSTWRSSSTSSSSEGDRPER